MITELQKTEETAVGMDFFKAPEPFEPLRTNLYVTRLFNSDSSPIETQDIWFQDVKETYDKLGAQLELIIQPHTLLSPDYFQQIAAVKIFQINQGGEILGANMYVVKDFSVAVVHSYGDDALLTYKLIIKA